VGKLIRESTYMPLYTVSCIRNFQHWT